MDQPLKPQPRCRVIIGNLPKSIFTMQPQSWWRPVKDKLREISQVIEDHPEPMPCDVIIEGKAVCQYMEARHAWEAYRMNVDRRIEPSLTSHCTILDYLQGHVWSFRGCHSILTASLYQWNAKGNSHKLAGPDARLLSSMGTRFAVLPAGATFLGTSATQDRMLEASFWNTTSLPIASSFIDHGGVDLDPMSGIVPSQYAANVHPGLGRPEPPGGLQTDPHQHLRRLTARESIYSTLKGVSQQQPGQTYPWQLLTPAMAGRSRNSSISSMSSSSVLFDTSGLSLYRPPSISSSNSSSSATIDDASPVGRSAHSPTNSEPEVRSPSLTIYRVKVYNVRPGTTEEEFHRKILEKNFGLYTKHAGIELANLNGRLHFSVAYRSKDDAKQVAKELNSVYFMGKKLQAHLDQGGRK